MKTEKTNIGIDEILNETNELMEAITTDKHHQKQNQVENILNEMLKHIEPVNFREYCKMDNDNDKLQKKHCLVACIEILLNTVNDNGFSLCRKSEFIYLFNSEYWENISDEVFKDFLGDVALKMGVDKFDAKHHLFKDELYKQFLADAGLKEIKPTNGTTLINLNNGTFEITPKKQFLRSFKKSDFLTYQLPFAYNKDATAPQFQKFLDEVLPEPELQNILAEYLGYIFVKNSVLKLEKVLLLFGTGANGKSVIFDIIMALLGSQNVCNHSLHSLTVDSSKSRINLLDKLLNYSSEINGKLESNIFKQMVSGVFNWVLNGLTRLLKNKKFTHSNIVKNEVLQYQKESDSVMMFIEDEGYQTSIDQTRPLKEVYFEYESYCKMNHFGICSSRTFSSRLKKIGFKLGIRQGYGFPLFIERIKNEMDLNDVQI
ncbi:MAG: DUF5906 domain-containing protein [Xanthomarina gelatinilytica]|uniref:DUF5906 domain-containing protein n=1 Tax=Xanthomarina gelatinilytica TaxID=1137281 RepID=UPI003A8C229F